MNVLDFKDLNKKKWFTFEDRLALTPEVTYATSACGLDALSDVEKESATQLKPAPLEASQLSKRHKAMGGQPLLRGTHCHEYLALDLSMENLSDLKKFEAERISRGALIREHTIDVKHGFYPGTLPNPSFMLFPSFWYSIFIKGLIMAMILIMPIVLGGAMLVLMIVDGVVPILKGLFFLDEEPLWLFWGYIALIPLNQILNYFEKRDWHRVFDPKEIPLHSAIKRNTGMVRIFNNRREWADLPFDEFEGFNTLVPMGRGQQTRKLTLRHRKTGFGFLLGEGGVDGWHPALLWEYYQHYMDVSRPLPDVPFFEPYRHLDPTTKRWDEAHKRPERYWRDMPAETYEEMVTESIKAAKAYPFLKPESADTEGWQPAGDGKHWYQLG